MDFGLRSIGRCAEQLAEMSTKQPTLLERLVAKKVAVQEQLDELSGLIASLEKYPDMEKMLTSLSRLF